MMFYYVNNADRTSDVEAGTLKIENQLQQRSDSCEFTIFSGVAPLDNQDIRIYDGALVASHSGVTIILQDSYETSLQTFRAGQSIWLGIGELTIEQAIVATYDEQTLTITLTETPGISLNLGDRIGEIIFGGIVARQEDRNIGTLQNLEYNVVGVGYSKIFDKKIIEDSWEEVDSRYIINSFVNTTVNYNITIDSLSYDDNASVQAVYTETGDAANPIVDLSDFMEGESCTILPWANSGGIATFTGSVTPRDLSFFVGAASGNPIQGRFVLWLRTSSQSDITSFIIRLQSSLGNHIDFLINIRPITDWQFHELRFIDGTVTGTPDWTIISTPVFIVNEIASGSIQINGLRVNAEGSFTLYNVQSTANFDQLRSPGIKPTELINQMAKAWEYLWYIDYVRDIHFVERENDPAPYSLTDSTNNFHELTIGVDTSNLGNRVIVRGGERTTASIYAQVFEGDNAVREWLLKSKFSNLGISIDDNSTTDAMEAFTTTTTVNATAHGLIVGDHIVNRTRSNAVREVLTVPSADQFTIEAVPGQTNGDTFSLFSVVRTNGIEGMTDETTVDYVSNSNEKSVRASINESTLNSAQFIRFAYNERIPIRYRYTDSGSANALRNLGLGDGIFDLDTITDKNIEDTTTAITIAQAKVHEFSNPVVSGNFKTDQKGLKAGQLIRITQTINRNIDEDFVIQKVVRRQISGAFKDYCIFTVTFGSTLFGWIEFMQKLLRTKDKLELNTEDVIEHFAAADEDVEASDTNQVALAGGFLGANSNEDINVVETNTVHENAPPWHWENSTGQTVPTRWNLFEWG